MGTVHYLGISDKERTSARLLADTIRCAVDSEVGDEASFGDRERAILALCNEAMRICLESDLQKIADGFIEDVEVDGCIYRAHESGTVTYHSLCGSLEVDRWIHRSTAERNGPTIVPLELVAGLIEHATPALAYRITLGYSKGTMRSCEEDMEADHRCPPSRSTLERIAKAIGTESQKQAKSIQVHLRRSEGLPEGAVAISLGIDRTSVPMEEDLPVGIKPSSRRKERSTPYVREKPAPVTVNYRMAYVGTISAHDAAGETIVTRRYAIGADGEPEDMVNQLIADLHSWLRRDKNLVVGVVQDGAPEMWNLVRAALENEPLISNWFETIDRYHLNERLSEVLRCVEPNSGERHAQQSRWNASLDQNDNAIYRIRQWIRDRHDDATLAGNVHLAEQLAPHLTYLENNAYMMRYARVLEAGLPVGSGATEGACKSVIESRTNGSGQRWRPEGLTAVLTLRAIYMSDRLPQFWSHLSRRHAPKVKLAA